MKLLAKRAKIDHKEYYQSLIGHTTDCLKIYKEYLRTKGNVLKQFCVRWEIDPKDFSRDLFYAIALHDIGKGTKEFQENINKGKTSQNVPHPFFGIPIIRECNLGTYKNVPVPLLAVLGHHSQLHSQLYESYNFKTHVEYQEEEILLFVNRKIPQVYEELGFDNYFDLSIIKLSSIKKMKSTAIQDEILFPFKIRKYCSSVKAVYSYFFSLLQLCDDYSSANFSNYVETEIPANLCMDSVLENPGKFVYDIDNDDGKIEGKLLNGFTPYPFQSKLAGCEKEFNFLYAPCGRGKTEAALLWAFDMKRKYNRDRIIIALPTQTTCNAMYKRLFNFGHNNIGLFHGKSSIALKYLKNDLSKTEEEIKNYDAIKDDQFKGNVFYKPITVTTIDHLAFSLTHGFSQADFACGNLQNSVIIFDEVHYYEPHTLNILLQGFQILKDWRIPHVLMTGTAPEFLINSLGENYNFVKDNEGLYFEPFYIEKKAHSESLFDENTVSSIWDDFQQKKTVFVIVNQIEWAKKIFTKLMEKAKKKSQKKNVLLYHSQFVHRDRVKKEKEIYKKLQKGPVILITTQVIEISLDISCDTMYTNIAPPDAIGQRGGRINRSKKNNSNKDYVMNLYNVESELPYDKTLMEKSWQLFETGNYSYNRIKEICDEIYIEDYLKTAREQQKIFKKYFQRNILFGDHYSNIAYGDENGKGLKIRSDNFRKINVVPTSCFDEANTVVSKKKGKWVEYQVPIPFYKFIIDEEEDGKKLHFNFHEENVIECRYKYNYKYGIDFETTDNRFQSD